MSSFANAVTSGEMQRSWHLGGTADDSRYFQTISIRAESRDLGFRLKGDAEANEALALVKSADIGDAEINRDDWISVTAPEGGFTREWARNCIAAVKEKGGFEKSFEVPHFNEAIAKGA